MRYIAPDPQAYIEALPPERKAPVSALRSAVRSGLPEGFTETMQYDMITYVVPHIRYPAGYHANPADPLPFVSIASQKNHIAVYHLGLYTAPDVLAWFRAAYEGLGIGKLDMGKSCIRFKNMDRIPYALITELCTKISVAQYIATVENAAAGRA